MSHTEFHDASTNVSLVTAYFQNLKQGPGKTLEFQALETTETLCHGFHCSLSVLALFSASSLLKGKLKVNIYGFYSCMNEEKKKKNKERSGTSVMTW